MDLGFDQFTGMTLRLDGINAPELGSLDGPIARDYLRTLVDQYGYARATLSERDYGTSGNLKWLHLRTTKDRREKYGRYLGTLWSGDYSVNLNAAMIDAGHAVHYDGGAR